MKSSFIHITVKMCKVKVYLTIWLFLLVLTVMGTKVQAQAITTASISGTVYADSSKVLANAIVMAEHISSATQYVTISSAKGKFVLPNMRVGGPYKIMARLIGFPVAISYINQLTAQHYFDYNIYLIEKVKDLKEVVVKERISPVLRNDATTFSIGRALINRIPNINRNLKDMMRLSPFAYGAGIIGANPRLNNFTIDGSLLITYGLGNTIVAGNTTGTDPIGIDAIEELQVNVAPFDVRQSGFTSAGINIITKKGDNKFNVSGFDYFTGNRLNGSKVKGRSVNNQYYAQHQLGFSIGGPILKNKLFYQLSYEKKTVANNASNYAAENGDNLRTNTTRVLASDLNNLSSFLKNAYQYDTDVYQGYNNYGNNDRLVAQLDWNLGKNSSIGLRVLYLHSYQDKLLNNDNLVGMGNRNNNLYSMSYKNSNYVRFSNALSSRLEYSSKIGKKLSQKLTLSYSNLPDYREALGQLKPQVDILKDAQNYISFGTDVFAPNNHLETNIYQLQEHVNFSYLKHNLVAGFDANLIQIENTFTPLWQGYYLFNSLNDFYNSTPAGTQTPIGTSSGLTRPVEFGKGYSLLPNKRLPTFNFAYAETGIFLQDNWEINSRFTVTPGLRLDRYYFIGNPDDNQYVSTLSFQKPTGAPEQLRTNQLPANQFRFSPRIGFSMRLKNIDFLKIHGGTGVFSGRIPMVLLGEQFRNTGLRSATFVTKSTQDYPFVFSPDAYTPNTSNNQGDDIVLLDKNFKSPQSFKNNLSFNFYLKNSWVLSLEGLYNKDISAFYVRNANIDNTQFTINANGRERLLNNAINAPQIQHAYVVANNKGGRQYAVSINAKKIYNEDIYLFFNYTYGSAKDRGSFTGTEPTSEFINETVSGNPNKPQLAYSSFDQKHRIFGFLSKSFHFSKNSTTSISTIAELSQSGRFSYTYAGNGDVNGDGVSKNDLIFVPANIDQINLIPYSDEKGNLVSKAMQWQALNSFIQQSKYLNGKRGSFTERNGSLLPFSFQLDAKITHQVKLNDKHHLQLSLDLINLPNLLNSNWGLKYLPENTQPIEAVTYNSFKAYASNLNKEYSADISIQSLWQLQFGLKYSFGN